MNCKRIHWWVVGATVLLGVLVVTAVELGRRHAYAHRRDTEEIAREENSMCVVCRATQYREVRAGVETRCDICPTPFSRWVEQNYGAHNHSWVLMANRIQKRTYAICGDAHYIPINFIPEAAHRRLLQSGNRDQIEMFHQAVREWETFPQAAALAELEWRNLHVPQGVEESLDRAEKKQHGRANEVLEDTARKVADPQR
jgi:hypothetical protein